MRRGHEACSEPPFRAHRWIVCRPIQGQNNKFDLSRIEDDWHGGLMPWVFNDPCNSVENALQ